MQVERAIEIPDPPHRVWAVITDWERQADWMLDADRVSVVSAQREGTGVRLMVKTRVAGMPAFTEPMEVTVWEPPHRLAIRHGGPVAGTGLWALDPIVGGTRFTWTEDVRLHAPLVGELAARGYAPFMRWLMGRALEGLRRQVIANGPGRVTRSTREAAPA